MTVELALLRSAKPEIDPSRAALSQRVERLEQALAGNAPAPAAKPVAEAKPAAAKPVAEAKPAGSPAAPEAEPTASAPPEEPGEGGTADVADGTDTGQEPAGPVAVADAGAPDLGRVVELWPGVLDQMRQEGAGMLSAVVGAARPVAVDPESGTLTIAFPPDSGSTSARPTTRRAGRWSPTRSAPSSGRRCARSSPCTRRASPVTNPTRAPSRPARTTCSSASSSSSTPRS